MNKIILITGSSGSAKTTILKEIEKKSNLLEVSINHFDHIDAPSVEDMISQFESYEK
jgi:hypothetical protein